MKFYFLLQQPFLPVDLINLILFSFDLLLKLNRKQIILQVQFIDSSRLHIKVVPQQLDLALLCVHLSSHILDATSFLLAMLLQFFEVALIFFELSHCSLRDDVNIRLGLGMPSVDAFSALFGKLLLELFVLSLEVHIFTFNRL